MENNIIETKEPLHKVIIKFSDKKQEQIIFFKPDVHIGYNLLTGQVGIYDEPGNCLFLAHWSLVDYLQVATDLIIKTN